MSDVADELGLDWHTVKELDKEYMTDQLAAAGPPSPQVIGIDEIAIGRQPETLTRKEWDAAIALAM